MQKIGIIGCEGIPATLLLAGSLKKLGYSCSICDESSSHELIDFLSPEPGNTETEWHGISISTRGDGTDEYTICYYGTVSQLENISCDCMVVSTDMLPSHNMPLPKIELRNLEETAPGETQQTNYLGETLFGYSLDAAEENTEEPAPEADKKKKKKDKKKKKAVHEDRPVVPFFLMINNFVKCRFSEKYIMSLLNIKTRNVYKIAFNPTNLINRIYIEENRSGVALKNMSPEYISAFLKIIGSIIGPEFSEKQIKKITR